MSGLTTGGSDLEEVDAVLLGWRKSGSRVETLLEVAAAEERYVLCLLSREEADDLALVPKRRLWLEMRRGIGRLDSLRGVELDWLVVVE